MGYEDRRLGAVVAFLDNVLANGRDPFGGTPTFADGLDLVKGEPVGWYYRGTHHPHGDWVICDFALQQNLLRTLVGASLLTGEARFRDAGAAAVGYHFDHLCGPCGLLYWGGHQFVDLRSKEPQGPFMGGVHEFKHAYPYYEFLAAVRPAATARFVRALWNAHVIDWSTLDMSRHGEYGKPLGALWASRFDQPAPFFEGTGLSFLNCGSDLILAAASLHRLVGEPDALRWAKYMDGSYVRARDERTGLGAYQYSQPRRRRAPVEGSTLSLYGDRAQRQFGPEFGPDALEGKMLHPRHAESIYGHHALIELSLAEELGDPDFREWAVSGMRACARWLYDGEHHLLRPMLTSGKDLTGFTLPRDGYYGRAGMVFRGHSPRSLLLWSFVMGHRQTGDDLLWETARALARGDGLGEIGTRPGEGVSLVDAPQSSDPHTLYAALELYATHPHPAYLQLAEAVGDNILARGFHEGYFLQSPEHACVRFDTADPLALLALEATLRGHAAAMPRYRASEGFLHGNVDDGPRTTDGRLHWSRLRSGGYQEIRWDRGAGRPVGGA